MTEASESLENYVYPWKDKADKDIFQPLFDAMISANPEQVRAVALDFAKQQFGLVPDDLSSVPGFPSWINSEELKTHHELGPDTFVLYIPKKTANRKVPSAPFLKEKFDPDNKTGWWWTFKYDDTGVLRGGGRLVSHYSGLPPEHQDEPDKPNLN